MKKRNYNQVHPNNNKIKLIGYAITSVGMYLRAVKRGAFRCFERCESCEKQFDIETMIQGEQWFCKTCYRELSKCPDFFETYEQ